MFFKKAKFFLDLTGEDNTSNAPVAVVVAPLAPVDDAPVGAASDAVALAVAPTATTAAPTAAVVTAASTTAEATAAAAPTAVRTTAEEMAAELAAAQANRPPASTVTFAPDRLVPGGTLPLRRRTGGANLAGFRDIARSMMKS
jgi:hypothetical protein